MFGGALAFRQLVRLGALRPVEILVLVALTGFVECARALAGRVLRECGGGDEERVGHAFRLALARAPRARERAILTRLLRRQRESLAGDAQEARALLESIRSKSS